MITFNAVMTQGHKRAIVNVTIVGSISTRENKIFNIFITVPWYSGNEAKRGVEFFYSTRNASRIWWKVGNYFNGERSVLTLGFHVPSCLYYISVKLIPI